MPRPVIALLLAMVGSIALPAQSLYQNTLTDAERRDGWKLLFDGKTLAGWRGYKMNVAPKGWTVAEGAITRIAGGADLITVDQYESFDLQFDWLIPAGGNSGVMFHVTEAFDAPYYTGPEYQILDNKGHANGRLVITQAGSNFALHPPARDVTKPVGQWNTARMLVKGAHVEHWMNGTKLLEYELWGENWTDLVSISKFNAWERYGLEKRGHIALQDHDARVQFRNLKIR